jgi:ethanolamine phosphate transferase 2 subunit G
MPSGIRFWTLLGANVLLVAGVLVFASGFFPYKAFLPGLATWQASSLRPSTPAPFDRVIFMVVDALRSDFVYGVNSNFGFTQGLIRSGAGIPFTGHASPPTITMPRVKAITTGSVPSFVDLVLNFAESDTTSTLATQDSWLAQIRSKGSGKLVHYGDDTWLRLFPGFFDSADGTTSFFVSDFTEVDNNVTRHITDELRQDDWSVMTLHYLGLDHIGHKTGPRGPNMPAKQAEMDGIVKEIYEALESQEHLSSTLLVLLGDHGMNEAGNHGASSAGEVSTALSFISPKFKSRFDGVLCPVDASSDYEYYNLVEQSDIAPTLGALLGFSVPKNNLGIIIPRLLEFWPLEEDRYSLLYENARQISEVARATFSVAFETPCTSSSPNEVDELACFWSRIQKVNSSGEHNQLALHDLSVFLSLAQRTLSSTASNYDSTKLLIGIVLAFLAASLSSVACHYFAHYNVFHIASFDLIKISYGITMFASSYVEEEHQFWYWAVSGYLSLLYFKSARTASDPERRLTSPISLLLVTVLFGIVRRWNQTGQKYAGDPDLLTQAITPNPFFLWTLIIITYSVFSRNLSQRATKWMGSKQMGILPVLVVISAFLFKVAFTAADAPELTNQVLVLRPLVSFTHRYPLLNLARVCFTGLAQLLGCAIYYEAPWKSRANLQGFLKAFQDIFTLFLLTQTRTVNIPLFLVFYIQMRLLEHDQNLSVLQVSNLSTLFQFASFFALGGTNAISSVDLSNAYNGIGGYNVLAVGALTFIGNWAGPIWWSVATCRLLVGCRMTKSVPNAAIDHFVTLTTFMAYSTLFVMGACYVLRQHLFIWTVFSPKYLYTIAWMFGQHLVVNGTCTLLLSRGRSE